MRSLGRWAWSVAVALSVLLFARAWLDLWHDQSAVVHLARFHFRSKCCMIDEFQGSLYWTTADGDGYSLDDYYVSWLKFFRMGTQQVSQNWNAKTIAGPYWVVPFLIISATLLRGVGVLRSRRRRRVEWIDARCKRCGYDLRATPSRCPECGMETTAQQRMVLPHGSRLL